MKHRISCLVPVAFLFVLLAGLGGCDNEQCAKLNESCKMLPCCSGLITHQKTLTVTDEYGHTTTSSSCTCVAEIPDFTDGDMDADTSDGIVCDYANDSAATGEPWYDSASDLVWQNPPADNKMNWECAKEYCANLNLDGHDDWRLPTIGQLRSLIRGCSETKTGGDCTIQDNGCLSLSCQENCNGCTGSNGPADGCYWPDEMEGPCGSYKSSSAIEDKENRAWKVLFSYALVDLNYTDSDDYVRCVRDGDIQTDGDMEVNPPDGDEEVDIPTDGDLEVDTPTDGDMDVASRMGNCFAHQSNRFNVMGMANAHPTMILKTESN